MLYYIDAKNEEHANWLRFINCARNEKEQNLLSFQYQGNIYCYTTKDILPGTELLVWYGEQYVKLLGLTVDYMFGKGTVQYFVYICVYFGWEARKGGLCHKKLINTVDSIYLDCRCLCNPDSPKTPCTQLPPKR